MASSDDLNQTSHEMMPPFVNQQVCILSVVINYLQLVNREYLLYVSVCSVLAIYYYYTIYYSAVFMINSCSRALYNNQKSGH